MRDIIKYIVSTIVALTTIAITGCSVDSLGFVKVVYDTDIVIRSIEQRVSGGDYTSLNGVVAYAYIADTTDYQVTSYDNALTGVVTHKDSGVQLEPFATAVPYESEEYNFEGAITMHIEGVENIMLVVADTQNEDYAYANYSIGESLPNTYITIAFRPWLEGSYSSGFWQFVVPEAIVTETEDTTTETE